MPYIIIPRCPSCRAINQADRREFDYAYMLEWTCMKCGCQWQHGRGSEWDVTITRSPTGMVYSPRETDYDIKVLHRPWRLRALWAQIKCWWPWLKK